MIVGIYKIDLGTEEYYIGQSINIEERIAQHKSKLKHNKHYNIKMQKLFNITDIFNWEILEKGLKIVDLYSRELYYINKYNSIENGLNISEAGIAGRGTHHGSSKFSREQLIYTMRLLLNVQNTIEFISGETGVSKSTVVHISRRTSHAWLDEEFPDECALLKEMSRLRVRNSIQRKQYKYTELISPIDNKIYKIHPSINEFSRVQGLDPNKVGQVMLGKRISHSGWIGNNISRIE